MKFRNRNLELVKASRESLQRLDSRLSLREPDSHLSLRGPQGTKQSLAAFLSFVCTLSSFVFITACSDFGERDNPLDPGAYNYVTPNDDAKSSSSSIKKTESSSSLAKSGKTSSSVEKSKSSSSVKSNSAASASSSSSVKMSPSSSSKKQEESSSSIKPNSVAASSSSSVKTQPSSSSKKASSSSEAVIPASSGDLRSSSSSKKQDQSSSSKVPEPAEGSSSSVEPNSVAASSSSSVKTQPSSSSKVPEPVEGSSSSVQPPQSSSDESSWTCGVSTITRGDYEYKTVVIKEQCWTKENLRYVPSVGTTMCYGDKAENCETYGRLYDFEAANLACPTGWRLPTSAEYEALAEYSMEGAPLYDAGAHFKATSGWTPENGDDFLEFTALPGGKCNEDQTCQNIGKMGYWWTSTEKVKNTSHFALALNGDGDSYSATNKMDNDQYISVRCVKK